MQTAPARRRAHAHAQSGKASTVFIVLGVLALVFVIGGVGCYFLVQKAFGTMEDSLKAAIKDNPVIVEHLGELKEVDLNLTATGEGGGGNKFAFDVTGSKGSGMVRAQMDQAGEKFRVTNATLEIDGTVHPLPMPGAPPAEIPGETPAKKEETPK